MEWYILLKTRITYGFLSTSFKRNYIWKGIITWNREKFFSDTHVWKTKKNYNIRVYVKIKIRKWRRFYVDVVVSRKRVRVCLCVCVKERASVCEKEGECVCERARERVSVCEREKNWFYYLELICFTVHRNKMKSMADTHTRTRTCQ